MEQPWIERVDWPKCDFANGPFEDSTKAEYRFNDGSTTIDMSVYMYWPDDGDDCDIAAYRLVD